MRIRSRPAHSELQAFVRSFGERCAALGDVVVTRPLPARPDQFIEIYLSERYRVSHDEASPDAAPEIVVVGPHSYRRTRLFLAGELDVFTIRFQPGGFHRLFGVDMTTLADQGVAATDVIGATTAGLRDAVLSAPDFVTRVAAAERWLADRAIAARPADAVAHAALLLLRAHGRLRIDALARHAGLGERQFGRRFSTQVGLAPKLYARTIRFNAVLAAKEAAPSAAWTDLVYAAGFADQAHFVRDSHALGGRPTVALLRRMDQRPHGMTVSFNRVALSVGSDLPTAGATSDDETRHGNGIGGDIRRAGGIGSGGDDDDGRFG